MLLKLTSMMTQRHSLLLGNKRLKNYIKNQLSKLLLRKLQLVYAVREGVRVNAGGTRRWLSRQQVDPDLKDGVRPAWLEVERVIAHYVDDPSSSTAVEDTQYLCKWGEQV